MKRRIVRALVLQFGHPRGPLGRLVGWNMATRSSNVARSRWAVDLLDLQPTDRFLEVGCGPGVALAVAAKKAATVVGVDRSAEMVRQARRRSGAEVHHASVEFLPSFAEPFDKALAVNTLGHWDDPVGGLKTVRGAMRPGGTIAVVSQPRGPRARSVSSHAVADDLSDKLAAAGFADPRVETLALDPPAVCVLAHA